MIFQFQQTSLEPCSQHALYMLSPSIYSYMFALQNSRHSHITRYCSLIATLFSLLVSMSIPNLCTLALY